MVYGLIYIENFALSPTFQDFALSPGRKFLESKTVEWDTILTIDHIDYGFLSISTYII